MADRWGEGGEPMPRGERDDGIARAVGEYRRGYLSRRDFLRRASGLLGGMAAAQMLLERVGGPPPAIAAPVPPPPPRVAAQLGRIEHLIVIYLENWSFDGLYGLFPGANGIANAGAAAVQVDASGRPYAALPPALDSRRDPKGPDPRIPAGLPNAPFDLEPYIKPWHVTGDLVHRFYQHQMQIDGGRNDKFVAFTDAGGLVMSHYDATRLPLGDLARQYTLGDNLFHSAFGGTVLNSMWLVSATTPIFPNAPASLVAQIGPDGALVRDGSVSPDSYMVNNFEPHNVPQRLVNPRAASFGPLAQRYRYMLPEPVPSYSLDWEDPKAYYPEYTLPAQTQPTIGDRLSAAGVSWAWYCGGWNDAIQGIYEQGYYFTAPMCYFANYNFGTPGAREHLKDERDLLQDLANGNLPSVAFWKPDVPEQEHPELGDLLTGEVHTYDLVRGIMNTPYWNKCAIVITYDEFGGRWDHAAPPVIDRWGPGSRVPLLVVSPFAKRGHVDQTQYETVSILKLIETRWGLPPLSSRDARANDLLGAFDF